MKLLILIVLFFSIHAHGKDVFPKTLSLNNTKLVKNGEGPRAVDTFFGSVDVYTAALYVSKKETNGQKILDSSEPKVLKMYYHHDAPKHKIISAWQESFKKQCGDCKDTKAEIKKFLASETDCASKTLRTLQFSNDKMVVLHNKKNIFESTNPKFAKMVLTTWLGTSPPTAALKKKLLGQGT